MQGVAIWFITEKREVLLQPGNKYSEVFQPIKGWVKNGESFLGAARRCIEERFGKEFVRQYPIKELVRITKKRFYPSRWELGVRCHFLGLLRNQQMKLIPFSERSKIRFIKRKDLPNVKEWERGGCNNGVVLFPDDYEILCWLFEEHRPVLESLKCAW